MYIVRGGKVVWSYNDTTGKGEISDAQLLSNGNVLFAHQFGVTLIAPDKKVLWNYDAPPKCEIQTAQMIGTNHVIFIQNGPSPKLFVANISSGRMEKEISLAARNTNGTHGQFRHARLTGAGTYLVAHMDMGKLAEYDENGKAVWSAPAPRVWAATRLPNGNTLIGGATVREINPSGETVWEFTSAEMPNYKFNSIQIASRCRTATQSSTTGPTGGAATLIRPPRRCRRLKSHRTRKLSGRCARGSIPISAHPRRFNCLMNRAFPKRFISEALSDFTSLVRGERDLAN